MPAAIAAAPAPSRTVTLSLISHTNAGKTTLARTLLRRDVGEVKDAPHVTLFNEDYPLLTENDHALRLWDTPGFGDTARLLKRLKRMDKPVLWFLAQTWDRFTDRPLWCSQQALKNVREEADVVLYLVNAAESPGESAYVAQEMEILSWIAKPVLVLLNQTGPPREAVEESAELAAWRQHLAAHAIVREVLSFDAFARCWIMEDRLMQAIDGLLDEGKRSAFAVLQQAWRRRNLDIFDQSLRVLADQLTSSVLDGVDVRTETFVERLGIGRGEINKEYATARQALAIRLAGRVEASTNELITLHGIEGASQQRMQKVAREHFRQPERVPESIWGVVGTFAGGAMGGLIADLKLGGLSFGSGALIGGLATGLGAYALIRTYNLVRAGDGRLHWSMEHFREQVRLSLLCYLAVAHFGRGRGEWREGEQPKHWNEIIAKALDAHEKQVDHAWKLAVEKEAMPGIVFQELRSVMRACAIEILRELYPDVPQQWIR